MKIINFESLPEEILKDFKIEKSFNDGKVVVFSESVEQAKKDFEELLRFSREIKLEKRFNCNELAVDSVMERFREVRTFLAVDMSVLDPVFAPGVREILPDGLSRKELFYVLNRLFFLKGLKTVIISGIDLEKDKKYEYITSKTALRIVKEFGEHGK